MRVFNGIEFSYAGMSASSFPARTVTNPKTVASFMMADAVSGLALVGTTYPDDTIWRSIM